MVVNCLHENDKNVSSEKAMERDCITFKIDAESKDIKLPF